MPGYGRIIVFLLPAAVALVGFGHSQLIAIRKAGDDKRKKWPPRLALGFGYLWLAGLSVVLVYFLNGRYRLAQLDSAIATVRELVAVERAFAKSNPKQGYTCSLAELPTDGWILEQPQVLTRTGQRNGYSFEIRGCHKVDGRPNPAYEIIARPLHDRDPHGGDDVCADQSGIVRFSEPWCDHK